MAQVTRYYIIPFVPVAGDRRGCEPKYQRLFTGRATAASQVELPSIGNNRKWRVDFYLVKITQEEADFAALDAQTDVIDVSRNKMVDSETKDKLAEIGVDVTLANTEDQVENRIFAWISDEPTKTIATERAFTNTRIVWIDK